MKVKLYKDFSKFKETPIGNLTYRQLIFGIIALALNAAVYFSLKDTINQELLGWVIVLISVPTLALGYIEKNNMPLEKYAIKWLKFHFGNQTRKYKIQEVADFEDIKQIKKKKSREKRKVKKG